MKPKHGDTHYFDIADEQFECIYDEDFKHQPYWYPSEHGCDAIVYGYDYNKGFKTKEACELYITRQVLKHCRKMLLGVTIKGRIDDKR